MIDSDLILSALQQQLNDNVIVANIAVVRKMEYVNELPNFCPWACVYKGKEGFKPRSLGRNAWETTQNFRIVVQEASLISGEECATKLNKFIRAIIDAINNDTTLSNTVDMLNEFDIEYGYVETDRPTLFFQTAIISLIFEAQSI